MSILIDKLKDMGCDIDAAMGRFLNNEDFYARCFKKYIDDPSFDGLAAALESKDPVEVFEQSHTLKGVSANMGVTPVYDEVVIIVEAVRGGKYADNLMPHYDKIVELRKELKKLAEA